MKRRQEDGERHGERNRDRESGKTDANRDRHRQIQRQRQRVGKTSKTSYGIFLDGNETNRSHFTGRIIVRQEVS